MAVLPLSLALSYASFVLVFPCLFSSIFLFYSAYHIFSFILLIDCIWYQSLFFVCLSFFVPCFPFILPYVFLLNSHDFCSTLYLFFPFCYLVAFPPFRYFCLSSPVLFFISVFSLYILSYASLFLLYLFYPHLSSLI